MQIIFLSKSCGDLFRFKIGYAGLTALILTLVLSGVALVRGGAHMGAERALAQAPATARSAWLQEIAAQRWQIAEQRQRVVDLNDDLDLNLGALAVKLGEMQAHVTRLNALGERLTGMAQLSGGEFDFSTPPAVGGPSSARTLPHDIQDIARAFGRLSKEIEDRAEKLNALESMLMSRKLQEQTSPTGRPLEDGWMSSGYGMRTDPMTGRREFHSGVDFTGSGNSPVLSLAAGVVSGSGWRDEYGNVVEINHGNGIVTRYAHNKKNLVVLGERVSKGQPIGVMGATGRTTGAHVHFEVLQDGNLVNPVDYVQSLKDAPKDS